MDNRDSSIKDQKFHNALMKTDSWPELTSQGICQGGGGKHNEETERRLNLIVISVPIPKPRE